jgi:ABC-type molybdate transport system substrate-binding protein
VLEQEGMNTKLTALSAGAIRRSVTKIARMFESDNRHSSSVALDFAPGPDIRERLLAGESIDVVIASAGILTALESASKIIPRSRSVVGRSRMAVMIRRDSAELDLSTIATFTQAMLNSDILVYNRGSSGEYAAAVFDKLGLRTAMGEKIHIAERGADMIEMVASHPGRVLGLAQQTNVLDQIEKGVSVALGGLFPDEIQKVTTYEIAVSTGSHNTMLADAFVRLFTSAEANELLTAAGLR